MRLFNSHFPPFKKDPDKFFIINYAPIFSRLSPAEKNLLMQKSKVVEYNKGDIIYRQSSLPDAFYCVILGRIRISSGQKDETLEYLNCGKYFGIISLLTGEPHSVNAQAVNDSKLLKIVKEDFNFLLEKIPRLAIDLSRTLSRRLKKKDRYEKKIFESTIISIVSMVTETEKLFYAANLTLSLKKETGKNVILVNLNKDVHETLRTLDLINLPIIKLDSSPTYIAAIKDAIGKDTASGIDILNIQYREVDEANLTKLNAILTQLTGDYHYVLLNLPTLIDEAVLQSLEQSDDIHIITTTTHQDLERTRTQLSEITTKINAVRDKIKVILSFDQGARKLPHQKICELLDAQVYAVLGSAQEERSLNASWKIMCAGPPTEYIKAIKRIAREIGDVRVGLALSGGAAFGLAHIGVLKVLERKHIPIDIVVGTSIGALIAALWAVGFDSNAIEAIASELEDKKRMWRMLLDPGFPKLSFARGKRIRAFLKKYIGAKTFQEVKVPLRIVACNLNKRQEVIFDSGSIVDAVMASIAIPGVFRPTLSKEDLIVDGGIIEPVPIGPLVSMGIKKIMAVNVLPSPETISLSYTQMHKHQAQESRQFESKGFFTKIIYRLRRYAQRMFFPNILDIIVNSMQTMEYVIAEAECERADIIFKPNVVGVSWYEFFKTESLIKNGELEALRLLPEVKELINE